MFLKIDWHNSLRRNLYENNQMLFFTVVIKENFTKKFFVAFGKLGTFKRLHYANGAFERFKILVTASFKEAPPKDFVCYII